METIVDTAKLKTLIRESHDKLQQAKFATDNKFILERLNELSADMRKLMEGISL